VQFNLGRDVAYFGFGSVCGLDQCRVIESDAVTNETASPCLASLVLFISQKILLIITKS